MICFVCVCVRDSCCVTDSVFFWCLQKTGLIRITRLLHQVNTNSSAVALCGITSIVDLICLHSVV